MEWYERRGSVLRGGVPLVTVDATLSAAALWVLRIGGAGDGRNAPVNFEADSLQAWEDAATALPRSLPFLWRPVQQARDAPHLASHLVTMQLRDRCMGHPTELRGKSFGLGFVLAMASWILRVSVPDDLIAIGTVDADGRIEAVEGMCEKIAVIEQHAPRIRRVLLPAQQAHEAQAVTTAGLEIVPVDKAARAVELVLGDAFRNLLRRSGEDPEAREELVDSFFRLVILGRSAAIDWTPVEHGATVALQAWSGLDPAAIWKLRCAQAVAARHESNRGEIPLPDEPVLRSLPAPLRVLAVVHLLQQCADTGQPSIEMAEALSGEHLVPVSEAFVPRLKLWSARARLMAVTGRPEEALRLQEELAQAFLARLEYEEVSYQLTEWYRLAGALEDRQAFTRAREVHARVVRLGGLGFTGSRYVDLALARARLPRHGRRWGAGRHAALPEWRSPHSSARPLVGNTLAGAACGPTRRTATASVRSLAIGRRRCGGNRGLRGADAVGAGQARPLPTARRRAASNDRTRVSEDIRSGVRGPSAYRCPTAGNGWGFVRRPLLSVLIGQQEGECICRREKSEGIQKAGGLDTQHP
jgi:hypothetical protein